MLETSLEHDICQKYSRRDSYGIVHCASCPLVRKSEESLVMCKAIGHYDAKKKTWVRDD